VSWNYTESSGKPRWEGGKNIFFSFLTEDTTIANSTLAVKKGFHGINISISAYQKVLYWLLGMVLLP
jgi:hypothetical protein